MFYQRPANPVRKIVNALGVLTLITGLLCIFFLALADDMFNAVPRASQMTVGASSGEASPQL